ncbi:membrane protein [Virgisporangium aliadipatigenens]|uniref:Membrane protein n=1 Tax=Virgisporangium aliadipatigenens TaxID=741659 RepID=A0A8J3YYJ6_9ACTN|nr:MFS transporter [Virgisporangium aliadipatigenens]GIJ52071.1 membrane protein [Virgisporangium aliadipatigenens]
MPHAADDDRPATFREVLAVGEFRALYLASALSWFGDYVARAAVAALVFQRTDSVFASAAAFAISYLPWLGFGPVLAALAERLPYRRTMVVTDVLRMFLMAAVALPAMPVWAMIALLFATSLCNPPFDAARSALLPKVLEGDKYVVALTLQTSSFQVAQIVGYLLGAGVASVNSNAALLFNAATFGLSAALIGLGVAEYPSAMTAEDRTHLLRETGSGIALVFRSPVLRAVAAVVFATSLLSIVPEGLAAAWAADLSDSPAARGWIQGAIMIANPVGFVLGGIVVGRFLGPIKRQRVIPYFALIVPVSLVPALIDPGPTLVYAMSFLGGFATAGLLPATNALFVQALPDSYRARAFGVMRSGIMIFHGVAVLATGWLAGLYPIHVVVGMWGLFGTAVMIASVLIWPPSQQISTEIARVKGLNAAAAMLGNRPPGPRHRSEDSVPLREGPTYHGRRRAPDSEDDWRRGDRQAAPGTMER